MAPGQRHRKLFELARELKAIAPLADAPGMTLKPVVREWHRQALPLIQTKPFDESWFDFLEAWEKVKYAAGEGPIAALFARAAERQPPDEALQYEQPSLQMLVALCRELQEENGDSPFFLSTRTASGLLNVNHATAARWLRGLRRDGVLTLVSEGSLRTHRASRYRYVPAKTGPDAGGSQDQ